MDDKLNASDLLIPEESLIEILIRYGLYLAAAFQIFCLASIFLKSPSDDENNSEEFEQKPSPSSSKLKIPTSKKFNQKIDKKKRR